MLGMPCAAARRCVAMLADLFHAEGRGLKDATGTACIGSSEVGFEGSFQGPAAPESASRCRQHVLVGSSRQCRR